MALQLFDRVQVAATANTTVSFTLGVAVTGYQDFSVMTNGNTTYYGSSDGTNWEVGIGTYSSTGPTLTRTTILSSSNAGSAVTFTSAPTVWIDYPSIKAVYQDASGNVGIGTSSPGARLDVTNTSAGAYVVSAITNLSSTGYVRQLFNIGSAGANGQADISYAPGIFFTLGPSSNDTTTPIIFRNNNATERMRIDSSGNVGIGTTSPAYKLDVNGQANCTRQAITNTDCNLEFFNGATRIAYLRSIAGGDSYFWVQQNNALAFATNNTERMRIDSSGNVGIGTSSPTALLTLPAGTATANTSPLKLTSGTNLTTAEAGSVEYDGNNFYMTADTSQGRNVNLAAQQFYLSSAVTAFGATIGNFFGANSAASLAATSTYDIECYCYFLKTTAGTLTWAPTFSTSATVAHAILDYTPVTGFTTTNISGAMVTAEATQQTVGAMTFAATASLTTAVYHVAKFKIRVLTNTACNFRLNVTQSAGTITPQAGSFYTVRKVITNAGNFVA